MLTPGRPPSAPSPPRRVARAPLAASLALAVLSGCGGGVEPGDPAMEGTGGSMVEPPPEIPFDGGVAPGGGPRICPPLDEDAGVDARLYAQAQEVLHNRCALTRCHGPVAAFGLMRLTTNRCDYGETVRDVPACQYDRFDRVEPGDLERSWMWIKLSAPYDADFRIEFEPEDGFTPPDDPRCADQGFGLTMPPPGNYLPSDEREILRQWILAGAPGPD